MAFDERESNLTASLFKYVHSSNNSLNKREIIMKNKFIKFLAILLCFFSFAIIGKAQSINRLVFETTFDFIIKEQTFTAGKYTIERLNPTNPQVLLLRQADGEAKTIFLTNSMISNKTMAELQLIFSHLNETYLLTGIWVAGKVCGYDIFSDKAAQKQR
jgi:hypothetical protein